MFHLIFFQSKIKYINIKQTRLVIQAIIFLFYNNQFLKVLIISIFESYSILNVYLATLFTKYTLNLSFQAPCGKGWEPIDAECRVVKRDGRIKRTFPWYTAKENIAPCYRCTAAGFVCENKKQKDGHCEDYIIRFLCYKRK